MRFIVYKLYHNIAALLEKLKWKQYLQSHTKLQHNFFEFMLQLQL